MMFRAMRIATAAVLALAIAALPAVFDRCAESCEAHRDTIASPPSCHHATSTGTRIAHVPAPCGHDHNGTAVKSAQGSTLAGRALDAMVAALESPASLTPAASDRGVVTHAPPGSWSLDPNHRSLPLRI